MGQAEFPGELGLGHLEPLADGENVFRFHAVMLVAPLPSINGPDSISRMNEPTEVRICLRSLPGGRTSLVTYDTASRRVEDTGLTATRHDLDGTIRHLKTVLEKAGNRVSVIELTP